MVEMYCAAEAAGLTLTSGKIVSKVVDGGVDEEKLFHYAEQHLVTVMNSFDGRLLENSVLVLDNARIHHSERFKRLLRKTGALVYFLSPCESRISS